MEQQQEARQPCSPSTSNPPPAPMADNKTSTAKLEAPGRPPVSSSSSLSTSSISSSSLANGTESSNNLKSRPIGAKLTPPGGHRYRRRSGQYKPSPKPPHVVPHYFRNRLATLSQIGEDWLYLALLGTIMALLSFSMDSVITLFLNTRLRLYRDVSEDSILVQYLGWTVTPIVLVSFSTGFVHLCSPTAIGSGIPEMKTILRGVVLNEYLTFRTLIAKIVGLTFTLGSGLPLGKEGPFVHMASIVATLLSKLVASFQGIYENESRTSEMLSAACAVGVAATFYAPIGGVLFSIEVTTVYFAVRNYWRGLFAACCGATIWRLLSFWIKNDESITALFKTNFRTDYPFDPVELLIFSFIGATCGLAGAAYIKFHRQIVQFFRRHKRLSEYFQKHRFVYPILVTFLITTVSFPPFLGKYTASTLNTHSTIEDLFSNRTWSLGNQDLTSKKILDQWTTEHTCFHFHLVMYILMLFWTSAVASTIPIPSGIFIPVLKMGAAYGRLIGEIMHTSFPDGITYGEYVHSSAIVPGSYAVVGAAAFSGAVTHTISTSVILFEMTGQIVHIIPVILAVLIANAVCQSLQPSIYDSIIEMKKLPYLPAIASSNSVSHKILVKDFMNTKLVYVAREKFSYANLKSLLVDNKKITSFPLVDSSDSMKLLGSVPRFDLLKLLYTHLGRERRLQEINRRTSDVQPVPSHLLFPKGATRDLSATTTTTTKLALGKPPSANKEDNSAPSSPTSSLSSSSSGTSLEQLDASKLASTVLSHAASTSNLILSMTETTAERKPVEAIAKVVNLYNRGTSLDEDRDQLQSSQQLRRLSRDLESSLKGSTVAPPVSGELSVDKPRSGAGESSSTESNLLRGLSSSSFTKNQKAQKSGLAPLVELKAASGFIDDKQQQNNPAAIYRPKSILKTSSTAESLNDVYRRNISLHSISLNNPTENRRNSVVKLEGPIQKKLSHASNSSNQPLANFVVGEESSSLDLNANYPVEPLRQRRRVRLPRLRVVDMTPEEQEQWETEQLNALIDIGKCQIDEAPFQLVQQTSLYRVHTLFSMLGLNHAYVTSYGRLVGIVALKDIRYAIEEMLQEK